MAGPNKSKLTPRRTVTAGQGDENVQLTKNEIVRLTALTGLMSLFMFGTDATDLFNEETPNTASMAKSMKAKSGKGLFPTLKDIAKSVQPFNKENGEIFKEIKQFGKNFKGYASKWDWMNKIKVGNLLTDIQNDIHNLVNDKVSVTPIIDAINNIDIPEPDPMFDVIVDALTIGNKDSIFGKLDDIILRLNQPATKQDQTNISKLLIEINGSTDLSKLIEQLYILGDKDIIGDTGILSKLDKIISGIKTSVEKSLDIDVSKSLSNINDINKLITAVQDIIINIQSIKLSNDIDVQLDEQLYKRINDIIEALNQINIDPKINGKIAENADTIHFLNKSVKTLQSSFLEITESLNDFNNIKFSDVKIPDVLVEDSNIFVGKLIEQLSQISKSFEGYDLDEIFKSFNNVSQIILSIKHAVDTYNDKLQGNTRIALAHFDWHAIPEELLNSSDRYFGKFIRDVIDNLNLISIINYNHAAQLITIAGNVVSVLSTAIDNYNSAILGKEIKIIPLTFDTKSLVQMKENFTNLMTFVNELNDIIDNNINTKFAKIYQYLVSSIETIKEISKFIDDYNSAILGKEIKIIPFVFDPKSLFQMKENIANLMTFVDELNSIIDINTNIELSKNYQYLISSIETIKEISTFIDNINSLDISIPDFNIKINDDFITHLETYLQQLSLLSDVLNSNDIKVSDPLKAFIDNIDDIRDIMTKFAALSYSSDKKSNKKIQLSKFAYLIDKSFIQDINNFIISLNNLSSVHISNKNLDAFNQFISNFDSLLSSLNKFKNSLNAKISLDKDLLNNINIDDEFIANWHKTNQKIASLVNTKLFDPKSIKAVSDHIEIITNIISSLSELKNQTLDTKTIKLLINDINDIIDAIETIKIIDQKSLLSRALSLSAIKSIVKSLNIESLPDDANENVVKILTYLKKYSDMLNEINTLNLPSTKDLAGKVYQFMELKKIFSIIGQFEPVNVPTLNFGSFIDDIKLITGTYIDPQNIEWIIPVILKISKISDILKDIDQSSLRIFAIAISNIANGLIVLSELNVNKLKNTFNELSTIEFPKQEIFDNIENIISNINNISTPDFSKIEELNEFLVSQNKNADNTIIKLFENLSSLLDHESLQNDFKGSIQKIKAFNAIIESIINISKIENPNIKIINKINKLIDDNGLLPQILQNINKNLTQQVSKNAEANLKLVMNLFETISNVGDIGIFKQFRMKMNIWFLKNFLVKDIISVITHLHKSAEKIKKEQNGSQFKIFSSFVDSIIKLAEIDKLSKIKMINSIWWLKHFIANMTTDIINQLIESTKNVEAKNTKDKIAILANFLESLPKIADFDFKKLIKYSIKVDLLRSFIRDSIQDLIFDIANLENTQEAKTSFDNIKDIIENMNDALDKLPSIKKILSSIIKTSTINDFIMSQLIKYGDYAVQLQTLIQSIDNDELTRLSSIIINTNNNLDEFNKIDYESVYNNIIAGIDALGKLNKFTNGILKVGKSAKEININSLKNIKIVIDQIGSINFDILSNIISKSSDTDKFIKNIKPLIKGANDVAKLGLIESAIETGAKAINTMIDKLIEGINKFDNVNQQSIENANETIDTFTELIFKSAAVLIFGSLAMIAIDLKNLMAFSVSLTGFIIGVGYALKCASSIVTDNSETIDAFASLIVKSSLILMIGSLIYSFLDAGDVLGFTIILTGFIFGVSYAYQIAAKSLTESMESARDFGDLVLYSGFILILGSLISHIVNWTDIFTFTGALLLLIGGTLGIYSFMSPLLEESKDAIRDIVRLITVSGIILAMGSFITSFISIADIVTFTGMLLLLIGGTLGTYIGAQLALKTLGIDNPVDISKGFIELVLASGLVLALGSLLTKFVKFVDILAFTAMLSLFIAGVSRPYVLFTEFNDKAEKGIREFSLMIITSGTLLTIGSLLTNIIGIEPVLAFTGMLTLFVVSTMLVYTFASKHMSSAMKGLLEFGALILISGTLLMIGSLLVKNIGWEPVAEFAVILGAFVGGIMFIYTLASRYSDKAIKGATEFGVLVLLSGLSLILGGLIVDKVGLEKIATFGVMLLVFVGGLMFIYSIFGNKIESSIPAAAALGIVSILSSFALGVGIMFMEKYPNGADKIFNFVLADLILVGGFAIIVKLLGKMNLTTAIQGTILLGVIVGIAALSGLVIGMIASIGDKYDLNKTWIVLGQIGTLIGGLTAIAAVLGAIAMTGVGGAIIIAGIALLGSIVTVAILAAQAMKSIASAMIAMQSVKKFDPKPIIEGVKSFVEITKELKPLSDNFHDLIKASIAVKSLKYVLSDISEAVKEYSELKIKIYKDTKIVGYRQLTKKDFKSAAENVKLIVETLGGAVIETYERNPEIFETNIFGNSPFSKVTKSLRTLGPMLSGIARSVKEYASLIIPIYTGTKLTGYTSLERKDFKDAADNVKLVIETLGGAVMESYDSHPDMFETNFWGTSPFAKVTKSLKTLGPMLSGISRSVKEYASLTIPVYEGTKIVKYNKLTKTDFESAANNVKLIIETLGGAIIQVYEDHPDYYETSGGLLGFGASSPFGKTIDANMKLAKLISRISVSVQNFASGKVPIKWDNQGNATEFESLTQKHFDGANKSIVAVITTLGNAVIESGQKMDAIGGPKYFKRVVDAQSRLGNLISKISKSVLYFANGKVPTGFDSKTGEPNGYENLSEKHFKDASTSIITVITTLGDAVMKSGEKIDEIMSPKKFKKVVDAQAKLGDLISKISESVLNFANGKVPIGYNADRSIKGYEQLGEKHFTRASNSIQKVITTLGQSIIDSYEKNHKWFEDGEDSQFGMACKAIGTMGAMISSIATGMQAYADMKIPIYDANGTITGYKPINNKVLEDASKTIGSIITNLGKTIMNEYDAHDDWFDDGPESPMVMASASIGSMGSMLSSIAEGIQSYANLMIPNNWDSNGNPIHFTKMENQDFIDAGNNIGKIVSLLGKTIINLYNGKDYEGKSLPGLENAKDIFKFDPDTQKDSPFNNVLNSCINMGEMITSIGEGVQAFALLNMPTAFDSMGKPIGFTKMDPGMFGAAATNISKVISTIGESLVKTYNKNPKLFNLPSIKKRQSGLAGFFGATEDAPNPGDPPFMKMMKASIVMGQAITSIAAGIQVFASGKVPKYDASGNIIGYDKMDDTVFTSAANAVSNVITIMGSTFDTVYTQHKNLFNGDKAKKITDATIKMGLAINTIARSVQTYASMRYATSWDTNGKPILFEKMNDSDFINAAKNINTIITTIAEAIVDAADNRVFSDNSISVLSLLKVGGGNKVTNMLNSLQKTSSVLSSLSSTIQKYANLKYAIEWDANGKPIKWKGLDEKDFTSAAKSIKKIITHIATSIVDAVDGNEKIFGQNIIKSPAYTAAMAVGKMGEALNVIAKSISYYAKSEFPVITWNNGKANTTIYKLNKADYEKSKEVIHTVTLCLASTIDSIYKEYPELFNINAGSSIDNIKNGVSTINSIIKTLSSQIAEISKIKFGEFVKSLSGESDSLKIAIDILSDMFDAIQYGNKTTITNVSERNILNPLFALQNDELKKLFEQIPDSLKNISTVVKILLYTISEISNQFKTQQDSIESLQIESINNAIDQLIKSFDKITELQNTIYKDNKTSIGSFSQNNSEFLSDILSIKDIVLTVLDTIKLWQDNLNGLSNVSLDNSIIPILKGYQEVASLAKSINSSLNSSDEGAARSLQSWFGGMMNDNDEGTVFENINALNTSITDLIAIAAVAEEYGINGYDIIGKGIQTIQNAIDNIKGIKTFSQHRDILGKYVNTVNTLDIKKMNSMTNFVNAMNKLASKMGNLDRLTLAIAENLTSVLEKLTVRMEDAKNTILKSEEMQNNRQGRLENTISSIKEIMSQKLTIEISQVDDTTTDIPTTSSGGISGNTNASSSRSNNATSIGGGSIPNDTTTDSGIGVSATTQNSQQNGQQSSSSNSSQGRRQTTQNKDNISGYINVEANRIIQEIKNHLDNRAR